MNSSNQDRAKALALLKVFAHVYAAAKRPN